MKEDFVMCSCGELEPLSLPVFFYSVSGSCLQQFHRGALIQNQVLLFLHINLTQETGRVSMSNAVPWERGEFGHRSLVSS